MILPSDMRRKTRRLLFLIATIFFLLGSYVAVLYAQGYKYSFSEKRFFRTGAISVRTNTDAKVFINDKLVGNTSFLRDAFSKGGLLPGQYRVRLQSDDFSPWQKVVDVQEGLVTDFPHIILVPQSETELPKIIAEIDQLMTDPAAITYPTPKPTVTKTPTPSVKPTPTPKPTATPSQLTFGPLAFRSGKLLRQIGDSYVQLGTNVTGFALSSSGNKVLFWTSFNDLWVVYLSDTNYQPLHKDGDIVKITHFTSPITKAVWFRDEDHIAVDAHGYKIIEIDTRGGVNIVKI